MFLIGSVIFPLKVDPVRIENNMNDILLRKPPKLNHANMPVFKNKQILVQ